MRPTLWYKLIEPHLAITDPAERQAARVVVALTQGLLVLNTLGSAAYCSPLAPLCSTSY